jgi:hypothetical protein
MSKSTRATLTVLILVHAVAATLPATIPAAAASTWTAPAWASQGTYGGILTMVANDDPDHGDLHQSCCNVGPGAARDLLNTLVMYHPVKPRRSSATWPGVGTYAPMACATPPLSTRPGGGMAGR